MNVQRSYLHEHRYLQSRYGHRPWFTTIETDSGALAMDDNFSLRNFPNQLQMACMPACCSTKHTRNSLILRSHDISLGERANYKAMRVGDVIRTSCFDENLLLLALQERPLASTHIGYPSSPSTIGMTHIGPVYTAAGSARNAIPLERPLDRERQAHARQRSCARVFAVVSREHACFRYISAFPDTKTELALEMTTSGALPRPLWIT